MHRTFTLFFFYMSKKGNLEKEITQKNIFFCLVVLDEEIWGIVELIVFPFCLDCFVKHSPNQL